MPTQQRHQIVEAPFLVQVVAEAKETLLAPSAVDLQRIIVRDDVWRLASDVCSVIFGTRAAASKTAKATVRPGQQATFPPLVYYTCHSVRSDSR
jgi:hypothetical protein